MQQDEAELFEKKLAEDRGKYYRGTVRVRFKHLQFGKLCPRGRNDEIVEYLKDKFSHACLRLDPRHRIPAVIEPQTLDAAIGYSPVITLDNLLDNPNGLPPELTLPPDHHLECLHGRQRVEAAKELLPPKDWWWTIDLYLKGASPALLTSLSEEYSDSINFSDGEIYLKICQYKDDPDQSSDTAFAEKRLWARLSKSKRRDLRQFLKSPLAAGFDTLRVIPGLWGGFRIGHKFMAMKCDEEILHYLNHILQVWSAILGENRELMQSTDRGTVELLQLRAPGFSQYDLSALETPFGARKLFPLIQNRQHRSEIWNNLQKEKRIIPSLWSLFEDIKFLKGPAKIMRHLFPKTELTIYRAMENIFTACNQKDDELVLQSSEKFFRSEKGDSADQFKYGYWQLWLSTWRHFTKLGQECPKKEDGENTPLLEEPDPAVWHWFGTLADKLGFESDQISELTSLDPDKKTARMALLMGRCHRYYQYDQTNFERFLSQIVDMYKTAIPTAPTCARPSLLVDGPGEDIQRRCGRTFRRAHENNRDFLFLDVLYNPRRGEGKGISSFYVRASAFFAFFGKHMPNSSMSTDSSIQPRDADSYPQVREEISLQTGLQPQIGGTSSQATLSTPSNPIDSDPSVQPMNLDPDSQIAEETPDTGSGPQNGKISSQTTLSIQLVQPSDGRTTPVPCGIRPQSHEETSDAITDGGGSAALTIFPAESTSHEDERLENPHEVKDILPKRISIQIVRDGVLRDQHESLPIERTEVERFAQKQIRKQVIPINKHGRALTAKNCFDAVVKEGRFTITLIPYHEFDITPELIAFMEHPDHSGANNKGIHHKRRKVANGETDRNRLPSTA